MFATRKELLEKIHLGESSFLELKEVRFAGRKIRGPRRDDLADELASFANSHGGVLVLGVRDKPREIVGIPQQYLDLVERFVHELCQDSIDPPIAPIIDSLRLPTATGKDVAVVKIDVPRSLFVHRSPGGFLYRIGSAKRVMSSEYLARLFQQRSQTRIIRFDEQIIPQAGLDDLELDLWERFLTPRSRDERGDFLAKLHMARTDDDRMLRPTVAGILMAAKDPRPWLPNAYVQAVFYRGVDIRIDQSTAPYQLDAADIAGPLDVQVVEACRFVAKNMKVAAFKYMGRLDRPQFDMAAVFEAMVNAVAHRDYSIHGSKIRLRLFSDRLELYSPGALPNTMTVEELAYLQSARNEIITSLLAKCPVPPDEAWLTTDRRTMMDRRGEGVRIIMDNSERLSGKLPEYRLIGESELMLTIWAADVS
jgi:predicted HTH transcriptional regulator